MLDQAVGAGGKVDFQDFFCLYDKLHFSLFDGDHDALEPQLAVIARVATEEPDRRFAAFMLGRSAEQLSEIKEYCLAGVFAQAARAMTPDDAHLTAFADEMVKGGKVFGAVTEVCRDGSTYHTIVQDLVHIHAGRYLDYITQDDYSDHFDELFEVLDRLMGIDPHASQIKTSLRRVKRDHRAAFDLNDRLFKALLDAPAAETYGADCPLCS